MAGTVLITGASRGIGAATARVFAAHGWRVALGCLNSTEEAASLAAELGGAAFRADVSDETQVEAMFSAVEKELGAPRALINNAGIDWNGLFQDMTPEEWDRLFAVNVRGAFLCTRRAVPSMIRAQSGSIVNVSSIWGLSGGSCEAAYSASKAALIGFTKALAKELGPSGIRVNCAAPGLIDTAMNARLSPDELAMLYDETPLGRSGSPQEAAEAIYWLAAESPFTTGEVLNISGGLVI